ncbi:putative HTH-type transcriptional regulator ArcR [Halalkalicoccus paucihalophilus]|uniref:Putative HTH-type transcriptional regulator ArcR n=1 Tax=Halalkalicoccus paucihalophilus TaxID=1008153 RepID=A0A151ABA1_9EURY|nr:IclR family transcriptional regulator [Halalkalicoccus paucihalophilus]KYH24961.1 putative HTH-type transcriptional regulator ArcR [Halalkalicoccus paucihalophilus]
MVYKSGNGRRIKAIDTTFAIVETLAEHECVRLSEIADFVGIANSTASEHLSTLQDYGYVVKEANGYRLGLRFMDTGTQAKRYYDELLTASKPVLEQLVNDTDETVNLVTKENDMAVYLDRLFGNRGVPTDSWVGKRRPLHMLAAGKAILAQLPEDELDAILDHRELAAASDHTITARDDLKRELGTIREKGISFNDRESHKQIRAVGTAIVLDDGVHGAVSVAGPAKRFTGSYFQEEIPNLLLGAVNEIELNLTYQ